MALEEYKSFTAENVEDLEKLGYSVEKNKYNTDLPNAYTEYVVKSKGGGLLDATGELAGLLENIPAWRALFSEVSGLSEGITYHLELRLYPEIKNWREKRVVALSKPIGLGEYFTLENLGVEIITEISSAEFTLYGISVIGGATLSFSASLTSPDSIIGFYFVSPNGTFPSIAEIIDHFSGGNAEKIANNIGKIFDIKFSSLDARYNYEKKALAGLRVNAEVTLGAFVFDTYFTYPAFDFFGQLGERHTPSFAEIAENIGVTHYPAELGGLFVTEASLQARPSASYYAVECGVDGELTLGGLITLTSLGLKLEHAGGSWEASLSASLTVSRQLSMYFNGEFENDGFSIYGSVRFSGNEASFWALFNSVPIPQWLTDLSLKNASIEYGGDALTVKVVFAYNRADVELTLGIAGKSVDISGVLIMGGRRFALTYVTRDEISLLYALLDGGTRPLKISPALIGFTDSVSIDAKNAYFALLLSQGGNDLSFGLTLDASLNFTSMPIAGSLLTGNGLEIKNISVYYNTAAFDGARRDILSSGAAECGIKIFDKGISVCGELTLPFGEEVPLGGGEPVSSSTQPNASTPQGMDGAQCDPAAAPPKQDSIKWIAINKEFGVINLSRLGVGFEDSALTVLLDAAVTLGCFKCALTGAGVSTPITVFKPDFRLDGVSLDYHTPTLSVSGTIQRILREDMEYCYGGGVAVLLSRYGFIAATTVGKMADASGSLMFSLYFAADAVIPVAPSVSILRLSAAFGYNEKINEPTVQTANSFPLVTGDIGKLSEWKRPSTGDYWGAAGIRFSVGEMLNGTLVLLAKFGNDLAFDLIGKAEITLPKKAAIDDAYLHAGVNIAASLRPCEGVFTVSALLTEDSFLLSRQCRLAGGLAFSMWFGDNPHSGEFVFTLGGYHPAFVPPEYYPAVPRLGFIWNISSSLSVKGEAYLALTPSCIMAGGRLEAVFQTGVVRAWFIASVDLLVAYHPFAFDTRLKIGIGVSVSIKVWFVRVKLNLSAGADLHLFGPPTSGTATVHLSVITFTIAFGPGKPPGGDKPIPAREFRTLLPERIHFASVAAGLLGEADGGVYEVAPSGAKFYVSTAIPIGEIDIRLMNMKGVNSVLRITISRGEEVIFDNGKNGNWPLAEIRANVPPMLWGEPLRSGDGSFMLTPKQPGAEIVRDQLIGYEVELPKPKLGEKAEYLSGFGDGMKLSLWSYFIPSLRAGEYTLTTGQNVAGLEASAELRFTVKSDDAVVSRYPAVNEVGDFGSTLPHILFSSPAFPFEKQAKGAVRETEPWVALITVSGDEFSSAEIKGNTITFDGGFIRGILPTHEELPYFAHVRETDGAQSRGVVFSCRLPLPGCENYACLLALDEVDIGKIPNGQISFTLLESWKFFAEDSVSESFSVVAGKLVQRKFPEYVVLPRLSKNGGEVSYRGLFAPDEARVESVSDTLPDVSYACAFENARLKLLSDNKTMLSLFSLRAQIANNAVSDTARSVSSGAFWNGMLDTLLDVSKRKLELDDIHTHIPNSATDKTVAVGKQFTLPSGADGKPTNELVTFARAVYDIAMQTADATAALLPVKDAVPDGSVVFFHIDKNTVKAAIDGVFSVGVESGHGREINNLLYRYVDGYVFGKLGGDLSGFFLKSPIVTSWKDTEVYAFEEGGAALELFESRELASDLCLYIFRGTIESIVLREPPHTLRSGLTSDGCVTVKSDGGYRNVKLTSDCFRTDGRTVSALAAAKLTDAGSPARFGLDWLLAPEQVRIEVAG